MKKALLRDAKMKDGRFFPIGTQFEVEFPVGSRLFKATGTDGQSFQSRSFSLFFKQPSISTLSKWTSDGIAKTVTGHRTEPDGYGPDNSPSWLLALGYI